MESSVVTHWESICLGKSHLNPEWIQPQCNILELRIHPFPLPKPLQLKNRPTICIFMFSCGSVFENTSRKSLIFFFFWLRLLKFYFWLAFWFFSRIRIRRQNHANFRKHGNIHWKCVVFLQDLTYGGNNQIILRGNISYLLALSLKCCFAFLEDIDESKTVKTTCQVKKITFLFFRTKFF